MNVLATEMLICIGICSQDEDFGNNGKGPVWCYPVEKMYSHDNRPGSLELAEMKKRLNDELESLSRKRPE